LPFFSSTNLLPANKKVSLTHVQFFLFQAFPYAIADDFRTLVGGFRANANGTKALLPPTTAPLARGCELFNILSGLPRFP
jgi:hypothetical protein